MIVSSLVFAVALGGLALADGTLVAQFGARAWNWLSYVVSFVVALGILIFIHELGHFFFAKLLRVGVERFSLGFGPRLWSIRGKETEYCVSAFPLGGYVKMVGEEAHGEELIHPATPERDFRLDPARSFALKPLWARALIVFAGPGMNFVLAAVVLAAIFAVVGISVLPATVGRVTADSPGAQAGLKVGDQILAVNGAPIQHWGEVQDRVREVGGRPVSFTVVRDGTRQELTVTPRRMPARTPFGEQTEDWGIGIAPYVPPVAGEVLPGKPAALAGVQRNDRIVAVDGKRVDTWDEMSEIVSKRPGETITLTVERDRRRLDISLTPQEVTEKDPFGRETKVGRIGISQTTDLKTMRLSIPAAVARGIERTWEMSALVVVVLWKLITGVVPVSTIGGPIQIGMVLGQASREGIASYLFWTAGISVNLAVLNLLPVPMLDGGHLLFFVIEAVLGRPLSVRKREVAQQIGLALLMLLMVFALGNDLRRYLPLGQLFK